MRRIVLDTETTGLDFRTGDRVVEIGCIEMLGRHRTGKTFHTYLNPEREVGAGAVAVHGLTGEFLADKPVFAAISDKFIEFIEGAELVIHNAAFDLGFLNNELDLIGGVKINEFCPSVTDTLKMARDLRPGKKSNLNALCVEFGIDNSGRQMHGALRDAELLAEVWLAMTRGQESMILDSYAPATSLFAAQACRPPLMVLRAADAELLDHDRVLAEIAKESKGKCLWQEI